MRLVWTIPVIAAAVAAGLVAAWARTIGDATLELARAAARLAGLRSELAELRAAARRTDARVTAFRARHGDSANGEPPGS